MSSRNKSNVVAWITIGLLAWFVWKIVEVNFWDGMGEDRDFLLLAFIIVEFTVALIVIIKIFRNIENARKARYETVCKRLEERQPIADGSRLRELRSQIDGMIPPLEKNGP